MAEHHHDTHFHMWGQNSNAYLHIYHWKGNFIRINIFLRTSVQKWTYSELLIENRRGIFLKVVFFVKNRQDMKK